LGHIHLPQADQDLHYPGSPCPLKITETGLRRFLLLDTDKGEISSIPVNSPLLYFDESFLMLPADNDLELLTSRIQQRIASWQLPQGWEDRVQVRVRLEGSAGSDRQRILNQVKKLFSPYEFYRGEGPDLSRLLHSNDPDRAEITRRFHAWLSELAWEEGPDQPGRDLILEQALHLIYGTNS
jgi:hypothetical protein